MTLRLLGLARCHSGWEEVGLPPIVVVIVVIVVGMMVITPAVMMISIVVTGVSVNDRATHKKRLRANWRNHYWRDHRSRRANRRRCVNWCGRIIWRGDANTDIHSNTCLGG